MRKSVRKIVFLNSLMKSAKEEKSNYKRLIVQENVISFMIIAAMFFIEDFLNKVMQEVKLSKVRTIEIKQKIKIGFNHEELEKKTLGQLIYAISPFLHEDKVLNDHLKEFCDLRNDISHKVFKKYETLDELEESSKKAVAVGDKLIKDIYSFIDKIE